MHRPIAIKKLGKTPSCSILTLQGFKGFQPFFCNEPISRAHNGIALTHKQTLSVARAPCIGYGVT